MSQLQRSSMDKPIQYPLKCPGLGTSTAAVHQVPSTNRGQVIPRNSQTLGYSSSQRPVIQPQYTERTPKVLRGVIIAAPQNNRTFGWIYCKSTNNTYQLPWSDNVHYMKDQVILFRPKNSLRGLRVEEARSLIAQNRINIKQYPNYFVSDHSADNIQLTTLLDLKEIHSKYLTGNSESIHSQNKFILNTVINVREGAEIEFKCIEPTINGSLCSFPMYKLVSVMERYLNGFINMNGGTIYFGIIAEGRIVGQDLYGTNVRRLVDELELHICEKLREWQPMKYVQKLVQSVQIEMVDLVQMDQVEQVGFVVPDKKVIRARIMPIEDEECKCNVVFASSERNGGVVYVRQLSSLCAYTDLSMQQQIGKRQIDKLNVEKDSESDIDFDDNDERDWVDVNPGRDTTNGKGRGRGYIMYFDGQSLVNLWRNMQKALPL